MLNANEVYDVLVANQAGGIFTAVQKLRITSNNSFEILKKIYLQREISQTISVNTATGNCSKNCSRFQQKNITICNKHYYTSF